MTELVLLIILLVELLEIIKYIKKAMEYAWRIQSETSAGMWSGKKKRVLISL